MLAIEISYSGTDRSEALDAMVRDRIQHETARFRERLTRVEAHLSDSNAAKAGPHDKSVVLEARPRGMDPIVIKHEASDLYEAVREASRKLERALARKFERTDSTP